VILSHHIVVVVVVSYTVSQPLLYQTSGLSADLVYKPPIHIPPCRATKRSLSAEPGSPCRPSHMTVSTTISCAFIPRPPRACLLTQSLLLQRPRMRVRQPTAESPVPNRQLQPHQCLRTTYRRLPRTLRLRRPATVSRPVMSL
jgi:hypothetical protein